VHRDRHNQVDGIISCYGRPTLRQQSGYGQGQDIFALLLHSAHHVCHQIAVSAEGNGACEGKSLPAADDAGLLAAQSFGERSGATNTDRPRFQQTLVAGRAELPLGIIRLLSVAAHANRRKEQVQQTRRGGLAQPDQT
jgi:hypothetical protein